MFDFLKPVRIRLFPDAADEAHLRETVGKPGFAGSGWFVGKDEEAVLSKDLRATGQPYISLRNWGGIAVRSKNPVEIQGQGGYPPALQFGGIKGEDVVVCVCFPQDAGKFAPVAEP